MSVALVLFLISLIIKMKPTMDQLDPLPEIGTNVPSLHLAGFFLMNDCYYYLCQT